MSLIDICQEPKLPAQPDHTFTGYLFLFLIDADGKISLCGYQQVPLDPGQTELHQVFCEDDSFDSPMFPYLTEICPSQRDECFKAPC